MKIQISVVGQDPRPEVEWPADWPVPRVDDEIDVEGLTLFVRYVVWYPQPTEVTTLSGDSEPFVYVVVGPRNPR